MHPYNATALRLATRVPLLLDVGQQWASVLISTTLRCKARVLLGPTPALVYRAATEVDQVGCVQGGGTSLRDPVSYASPAHASDLLSSALLP
jgi:hypothetical protein